MTNDTRYPANDFARPDRQFQFGALFGHRNYAAALFYEPVPDRDNRLADLAMLKKTHWRTELERSAAQHGWTHLVIHRNAPHPGNIPLPLVFDSPDYRVYRFQH